jgi:uncharacterized damage-inducible protein DinB
MTVGEIKSLFDFDRWATDRTLESVSAVPEEEYFRDLKSSHGGIHGTLVHTYSASWLWLARWNGIVPAASDEAGTASNLEVLKTRWDAYREDLRRFLEGCTESRLSAPLSYRDKKGNPHAEPLYQQMQHVVNHGTYHRGQVVTMLRQVGATPQATDLVAFYRLGPEQRGRA